MRSAICSRSSSWELRKDGSPMILPMGMFFVDALSSHASYRLGTGLRILSLP